MGTLRDCLLSHCMVIFVVEECTKCGRLIDSTSSRDNRGGQPIQCCRDFWEIGSVRGAVIAILITIMALELKIPYGSTMRTPRPLVPIGLTYVLSFAYLGIY